MREILFRGKRISDGKWVQGGIVHTFHPNFPHKSAEAFNLRKNNCYAICANNKDYFIEQNSIGLHFGFFDKNNKAIFTGDIVSYHGSTFKVVYMEYYARFALRRPGTVFAGWTKESARRFAEVIGNIRDNPELLETSQ